MLALAVLASLAQSPATAEVSDYLVVLESSLSQGDYGRAASRLAEHRGGETWLWKGGWEELEKELLDRKPRYLALVLSPASIDANLPRRLVPLLTRFDEDPFVDCAFGIITGATGAEALSFVENILRAPEGELPARKFKAVAVTLDRCVRIPARPSDGSVGRVLESTELWMTGEQEGWKDFLAQHRRESQGAGLVEWGHCGDSQGIWLFSMYRNMDEEKHWKYAPEKVGWDPEAQMPRMTPMGLLEGVNLFPAVVINGSCHSAVTRDTVVGGDIVSTFGDTDGIVRFHPIEPEESFPLMAIRHGATAYIAPLAANNANRASLEEWWILEGGTPLGEVMKRTYDELVMGSAKHKLAFPLFVHGVREQHGAPMFDDTVHRVLFGDPAFVAWRDRVPTSHQVEVERTQAGLRIEVRWDLAQWDPWVWDPWRETRDPRGERGRIYERIPLEEEASLRPRSVAVEAFALRDGEWTPLELEATALLEIGLAGEPILHLKGSGARADMCPLGSEGPEALRAVFQVR